MEEEEEKPIRIPTKQRGWRMEKHIFLFIGLWNSFTRMYIHKILILTLFVTRTFVSYAFSMEDGVWNVCIVYLVHTYMLSPCVKLTWLHLTCGYNYKYVWGDEDTQFSFLPVHEINYFGTWNWNQDWMWNMRDVCVYGCMVVWWWMVFVEGDRESNLIIVCDLFKESSSCFFCV